MGSGSKTGASRLLREGRAVGGLMVETAQVEDLQMLRAEDVAGILKVTPSAVFKWAKAGLIPSYRINEKCLRFKRGDVAAFVEKGKGVGFSHKRDGYR